MGKFWAVFRREYTERVRSKWFLFATIFGPVLFGGLLFCVGLAVRTLRRSHDGQLAYQVMRESFGGVILLGLEILVAADLVRTVAVAPTRENVIVLAIIVLIRTVLSFSLEVEIDGMWPWELWRLDPKKVGERVVPGLVFRLIVVGPACRLGPRAIGDRPEQDPGLAALLHAHVP